MNNIFPPELAALPQWVCWRLEKDAKGERDTKIPYNPRSGGKASSTNADTWTTLDFAQKSLRQHSYTGLGFVFTKEAGIVGVDIDHCMDPATGALNETAAAILEKVPPTYVEISPSGMSMEAIRRVAGYGAGFDRRRGAAKQLRGPGRLLHEIHSGPRRLGACRGLLRRGNHRDQHQKARWLQPHD